MGTLPRDYRAYLAMSQAMESLAIGTALSVIEPTTRLYIRHEDLQTPSNGWALFGPFSAMEIEARLNGPYGDALAASGDLDAVEYTDDEIAVLHVNTRDWWMAQEEACS